MFTRGPLQPTMFTLIKLGKIYIVPEINVIVDNLLPVNSIRNELSAAPAIRDVVLIHLVT